ncbi:MAG: SDR family oxidoreductase [Clostridia bacterium]|nr:SDR family oxidoreductase [Clostridia bacterium]
MQTLKGRTAVMAGATAGDGRETVKTLCAGGMNVVMMTHNRAAAEALADEIKTANAPGECIFYVSRPGEKPAEEDPAVYEEIRERFGSVDVIIANTGADGHRDSVETLAPEELERSLKHLTVGAFRMLQTALPFLKQSSAPRVILMSTVEGIHGGTHESLTNAVAKGAVASLALNAAARLAPMGITVNCIAKGAIPRVEGVRPGDPDPAERLSSIPLGRLGSSKDLAETVAFLASEEAAYLTGQLLELSGGLNLGR